MQRDAFKELDQTKQTKVILCVIKIIKSPVFDVACLLSDISHPWLGEYKPCVISLEFFPGSIKDSYFNGSYRCTGVTFHETEDVLLFKVSPRPLYPATQYYLVLGRASSKYDKYKH